MFFANEANDWKTAFDYERNPDNFLSLAKVFSDEMCIDQKKQQPFERHTAIAVRLDYRHLNIQLGAGAVERHTKFTAETRLQITNGIMRKQ